MPGAVRTLRWTDAIAAVCAGLSAFILYTVIILVLAAQGLLASQSEKLNALISETEKIAH